MSLFLPPELLDLIADHLHKEPATLKACCIVSKSWISRTRKYLFAHIQFFSPMRSVELWKQTFPDPSSSLAPYTRTFSFLEFHSTTLVNPDVIGWIRSFDRVENLFLGFIRDSHGASLVQLHGFSPALKSISLAYSTGLLSKILNFISTFPLLEDLVLMAGPYSNDTGKWISPSTSPKFTGSLHIDGGVPSITRWLCGLPGGLHFRQIHLSYQDDYTPLIASLVSKCSNTLESLIISGDDLDGKGSLNLSTATKLKDVVFTSGGPLRWINTAIETIKSKDLQRVTIVSRHVHVDHREWGDLDRLLAQLWTSHSIRPTITFDSERKMIGLVPELLPELTKEGAVDVFEDED